MTKITIKSEFLSDLRRFSVDNSITYKEFIDMLTLLYKLDNLRVKYYDEDKDIITITSDRELQEAFEFAKSNKNFLRIVVFVGSSVRVINEDVADIYHNLKSLTDHLRSSQEMLTDNNNNNNNNNTSVSSSIDSMSDEDHHQSNNSNSISPTASFYLSQQNQPSSSPSSSAIETLESNALPSWGKNSMFADDFEMELNNQQRDQRKNEDHHQQSNTQNTSMNNNFSCITNDGSAVEVVKEVIKKKEKISQIVSEQSTIIVKDLKDLTSKIADLVMQSGEIPLDVKGDLIQTNIKLAEMALTCQVLSQNAVNDCNLYSNLALNLVNNASEEQKKSLRDNQSFKDNQVLCDSLRLNTLQTCSNLSSSTAVDCMKGANSIRDLIMDL